MSIKLKVCGMRQPDNIQQVGALLPDYMGFIFYERSPRCVPDDFVIEELYKSIRKVGVFVNEELKTILNKVNKYSLDFVQLHGEESVSLCEEIKGNNIGVIKTFSVDENFDFKLTEPYQKAVDFFLFDTKGKHFGGNGSLFDWGLLRQYNQQAPFFFKWRNFSREYSRSC